MQLHCCGVTGSDDFKMASEFIKYTNQKGDGQVVPEACCKLDTKFEMAVFKPSDDNCIYAPSTSNSYMNRVSKPQKKKRSTVLCGKKEEISFDVWQFEFEWLPQLPDLFFIGCSLLQGCYDTVYDFAIRHLNVVIGVCVGLMAIQILGIIFAFCLCKAVGNDRDYHYKY